MDKSKIVAVTALGFFLAGCSMSKNQAALVGATVCGAGGAAMGGVIANNQHDSHKHAGAGAAIGAVTGALVCGALGYLLAQEPKPPPPPPPPPAPKVERTISLDDVLFDFDKSTIKPEAAAILDRLVAFMNENKDKKVNLSGHTDSIGTEAYNQKLSERRANSVKAYIVKKGIDASRISAQGFGETKPIADNKTKAGRAKNRRVEIKVN